MTGGLEVSRHRYRVALWVLRTVVALALVAGLTLGLVAVFENQSNKNALADKVNCLETALRNRNAPADADSAAELIWIASIQAILTAKNPTPEESAEESAAFVQATVSLFTTLQTDKAYRAAHPLGAC